MALIAYWIAVRTADYTGTPPTGAQIAAGNQSDNSAAELSGTESGFATTGTIQIDETTAITTATPGVEYTQAWTVYDDGLGTYSTPVVGTVETAAEATAAAIEAASAADTPASLAQATAAAIEAASAADTPASLAQATAARVEIASAISAQASTAQAASSRAEATPSTSSIQAATLQTAASNAETVSAEAAQGAAITFFAGCAEIAPGAIDSSSGVYSALAPHVESAALLVTPPGWPGASLQAAATHAEIASAADTGNAGGVSNFSETRVESAALEDYQDAFVATFADCTEAASSTLDLSSGTYATLASRVESAPLVVTPPAWPSASLQATATRAEVTPAMETPPWSPWVTRVAGAESHEEAVAVEDASSTAHTYSSTAESFSPDTLQDGLVNVVPIDYEAEASESGLLAAASSAIVYHPLRWCRVSGSNRVVVLPASDRRVSVPSSNRVQ